MVSRGADGSLSLQPYDVWVENFNRLRREPPSQELRDYLRWMSSDSLEVAVDTQGRVAVPPETAGRVRHRQEDHRGGHGQSYMELWAPEAVPSRGPDKVHSAAFDNEFFR